MRKLMAGLKIGLAIMCFSMFACAVTKNETVSAADLSNFDAGNIISDAVFYNSYAMTAEQIQAFLNSKVPVCKTYTYGTSMHQAAPCLKDFRETTNTKSADAYCNGYGEINQSAAEIIKGVADSCGVNPQVLIVMLQKEQGIVTDTWPRDKWLNNTTGNNNYQYRSAMGYGCPDTALCDTVYYGFFNQVYYAARQFKMYHAKPNSYSYIANRNNNILWNPNSACGASTVYIQNQATANLYNYTPYRPNQAALNAGYANGDSCSSYGNRNFYLYFTDWFGSTQGTGRWMEMGSRFLQLGKDASMIDPNTMVAENRVLPENKVVYFTAKTILSDGRQCLRPDGHSSLCILWEDLKETKQWLPMGERNLVVNTEETNKISANTLIANEEKHKQGDEFYFTSKIILEDGEQCLRTQSDGWQGLDHCIRWSELREQVKEADWLNMGNRYLTIKQSTHLINANTLIFEKTEQPVGKTIYFNKKIILPDGRQCLRPDGHSSLCILWDTLEEYEPEWAPLGTVRDLVIRTAPSTTKINLTTMSKDSLVLNTGRVIRFATKTIIPNTDEECLRSQYDTNIESNFCVRWSDLKEVTLAN